MDNSKERVFSSAKEAEDFLEMEYKGKLVKFWYWNRKKQELEEKVSKVDKISIDTVEAPPQVVLFMTDGFKYLFDKDEFFEYVKILD